MGDKMEIKKDFISEQELKALDRALSKSAQRVFRQGSKLDTKSSHERELIEMLMMDNKRLRSAGCKLAEAALRVATEYDGIHRLMLATADWSKAVADEGGRGNRSNTESEDLT